MRIKNDYLNVFPCGPHRPRLLKCKLVTTVVCCLFASTPKVKIKVI